VAEAVGSLSYVATIGAGGAGGGSQQTGVALIPNVAAGEVTASNATVVYGIAGLTLAAGALLIPGAAGSGGGFVFLEIIPTASAGPAFDFIAESQPPWSLGPVFEHYIDTVPTQSVGPVFDHDAQPLIIAGYGPVFDHFAVSLIPGFGPSFDHDATEVPLPYAFPLTPVPPNTDRLRLQPSTFGSPAIYPGGRGR